MDPRAGNKWAYWADVTKHPAGELLGGVIVGKAMDWDGRVKMLVDSNPNVGDISDEVSEVLPTRMGGRCFTFTMEREIHLR